MLNSSKMLAAQLAAVEKQPISIEMIQLQLAADAEREAYAIQAHNIAQKLSQGARVSGKKIGLTNLKVQQQFGVNQPDFGILLDHMDLSAHTRINISQFIQPKVEVELAFLIHKTMDRPIRSIDDMQAYISHVIPAFEIVDSRILDWKIRFVDTVADNASSAAYVLSTERKRLTDVNCLAVSMILKQNGHVVSTGSGHECLGHPLSAAMWLGNKMLNLGTPVQAGEIILSGALGPMVNVKAGDEFEAILSGFSAFKLTFI